MLAIRCKMARTKQELLKKGFPNPLTNPTRCDTINTKRRRKTSKNRKGIYYEEIDPRFPHRSAEW